MRKLSSKQAERVYDALQMFANASPNHWDREEFIYHFSVLHDTSDQFKVKCMDGSSRTVHCLGDREIRLEGKGSDRVNPLITRILTEAK
jgi:hypothetical protein